MVSAGAQSERVVTLRLEEWTSAIQLSQDMKAQLDAIAEGPVFVIVDLSASRGLDQPVKAALYRLMENSRVLKVGFCGASQEKMAELSDLLPLLEQVRPVVIAETETEVRQKLGLSRRETDRTPSGMLRYLKKADTKPFAQS